jgi:recombinational DNA repair ATPase RecF
MYIFNVYICSPKQIRSFMDTTITNVNNKHPKKWCSYTHTKKKEKSSDARKKLTKLKPNN